jgi:fatty-acyl-CoA synthase
VAQPHDLWGEVPVAFVTLRTGGTAGEQDLQLYVRDRIAHFKVPKQIVFGPLPKTSTGKIKKNALRVVARASQRSK